MSVIIHDMDMPNACHVCQLYSRDEHGCMVASYGCVDRYNYDTRIKPKWCPLEEVEEEAEKEEEAKTETKKEEKHDEPYIKVNNKVKNDNVPWSTDDRWQYYVPMGVGW